MSDIQVLDTTFRDGKQQEGMEIDIESALRIVRKMAKLGIHYAELGFAGSSPFVSGLIEAALQEDLAQMKIAVFGRTKKFNERVEESPDIKEIVRLGVPVAVLVCKSRVSDVHEDLKITLQDNLNVIYDSVSYLKSQGVEVILDLEHAVDAWFGRGNFGEQDQNSSYEDWDDYVIKVVKIIIDAGADCIVVCDSNGGASPEEITKMFVSLKRYFPETSFGFHGHNDNELAVANSRAAILAGAQHVQGTINGYGERCGNTNLCSLVPRLQVKDGIEIVSSQQLMMFKDISDQTANYFGKILDTRSPFVGRNAFTTFAGMHASSEGKSKGAYLQCCPEAVGNMERIGINSQSGRSNILAVADNLGIVVSAEEADRLLVDYADYVNSGVFNISETSFKLACLRIKGACKDFFSIKRYQAKTERGDEKDKSLSSASLFVGIGEEDVEWALNDVFAKGSFDSLAKGLTKMLSSYYPEVENVHLVDYRNEAVGVSEKETGALVIVSARFSSNGGSWLTVGVSTDQTDAALRAYVAGIRWFLFNLNKY